MAAEMKAKKSRVAVVMDFMLEACVVELDIANEKSDL